MSKGLIALIVVAVLGLSIFMGYRSMYNNAVTYQEKVTEKWGNVGADYQRRADLIPQLVATVKGAAANEKGILTQVQNFLALQNQLEGTENRIAVSRKDYNEAIMVYNSHIRGFFSSMFLNASIFPHKDPFKEAAGSEKAPEVKF